MRTNTKTPNDVWWAPRGGSPVLCPPIAPCDYRMHCDHPRVQRAELWIWVCDVKMLVCAEGEYVWQNTKPTKKITTKKTKPNQPNKQKPICEGCRVPCLILVGVLPHATLRCVPGLFPQPDQFLSFLWLVYVAWTQRCVPTVSIRSDCSRQLLWYCNLRDLRTHLWVDVVAAICTNCII